MPTGTESDPVEVRAIIVGMGGEAEEDGVTTISFPHHQVHEGLTFLGSASFADVADDGTAALLLRTGGKDVHATFDAACGGDARIKLYEDTTPTANGTAVTLFNLFRRHPNTAQSTLYHTPTVPGGNEGTQIETRLLPGGRGPQSSGDSLVLRQGTEWILKPASVYYLLATNISGNTKDISLSVQFYEFDEEIE